MRATSLFTGALAIAPLFGGCAAQPSAVQKPAAHSPCNKLAHAQPAPAAVDQRRTPLYHYAICYPQLGADRGKLVHAMHDWADKQLNAFLKVADRPRPQPWTYELLIDFRVVAQGKGFASVLARGYTFTGGAHGQHLLAGFTLANGQLIDRPDALFGDPQRARAALSTYVRNVFAQTAAGGDTAWCFKDRKWLREGTAPTAENYGIATLTDANGHASGMRLYFTPYQVAPYACGTQTVDVPATAFRPWLSTNHRNLFAEPGNQGLFTLLSGTLLCPPGRQSRCEERGLATPNERASRRHACSTPPPCGHILRAPKL